MLKNLLISNNKAVSLIEIIVTITIIFILSAMSVYSYQDYKIKALFNSAFAVTEQNKLAISNFYASNKSCPPSGFITQMINTSQCTPSTTTPCVSKITNDNASSNCILNLKDANNNTIISFQAMLSVLGDLQYFCVVGSPAPPNKYLSINCNGLPASGFTLAT